MSRLVLVLLASTAPLVPQGLSQPPPPSRVTTETVVVAAIGSFKQGTITVTADGHHLAYGKKQGSGFAVEVDGRVQATHKALGPIVWWAPDAGALLNAYAQWGLDEVPGIKPMIFSGDGQHLAYGAKEEDSWFIVRDGQKGKRYKNVGGPVLTRDGQHLAHAAKVDGGWCIVRDGVEGKAYEKVGPPVFSGDGRHLAYGAQVGNREVMVVDGVEGKAYDNLDTPPSGWPRTGVFTPLVVRMLTPWAAFRHMLAAFPAFTADGRVCHAAERDGKWYAVTGGLESEPFEEFGFLAVSPDGNRLAYAGQGPGGWTVVLDGRRVGTHQAVAFPVFSPDGNRLAYAAKEGGQWMMVIDGTARTAYRDLGWPVFSSDGTRVAYGAKTGDHWAVVVDGKAQQPYEAVDLPVFSPDGTRVAYPAFRGSDRWTVVVDGVEGREFRGLGLVRGTKIVFDDNARLHYLLVTKDERILLVEEDLRPPT